MTVLDVRVSVTNQVGVCVTGQEGGGRIVLDGNCELHWTGWDVARQLVEHRTGKPQTLIRFPGATSDFSPRVNFQCRLSYGVCTPPFAIAYICAHTKDPVVHVRVWWIMETLK